MPDRQTIGKLLLAWLPFYVLWAVYLISYYEGQVGGAFGSSLWATGAAAALSPGVWWFSGRHPWPDRMRPAFYGLHLLAALPFTVAWITACFVTPGLLGGMALGEILGTSYLSWYVLMGLLIYAIVTGICYAMRNQHRAREQARLAAEAEALATQVRLRALQAQLNPHFLFNALHALSTLIRHDPDRAEQAVEQLGDLLRYTLDQGPATEMVTLADEWAFTRDYLALQRLRLGTRLKVETDISTDTMADLIPRLVLQPLVENAVRHAIVPRPEGGRVFIGIRRDQDRLTLTVRDDGPGLDAAATEEVEGHGLHTLRARLHALYGPAAFLAIETAPGEGYCARLTVPLVSEGARTLALAQP